MKISAKKRQTLLDVALQTGGTIETALAFAATNNMSVTDRLDDGQELTVPESVVGGGRRTVELYRAEGVEPATEASAEDLAMCPYGGVGFMGIGIDFEVS